MPKQPGWLQESMRKLLQALLLGEQSTRSSKQSRCVPCKPVGASIAPLHTYDSILPRPSMSQNEGHVASFRKCKPHVPYSLRWECQQVRQKCHSLNEPS